MRIMTVEQVPQLVTPAGHWTSVRLHFQTKNGLFEPKIPFQGRFGMILQVSEITFSAGSDANEVCHRGFELVEKLPRGPSLSFFRILKGLPDAFLGVGMGSNIEQSFEDSYTRVVGCLSTSPRPEQQESGCFRQYPQERGSRERMSSFIAQNLTSFLYWPVLC